MLDALQNEASRLGKPEWRPLLGYVAELHARSTHPARPPFSRAWEEIGPGYCYGPAFGHWDIVHQILDVLPAEPDHARDQILNDLENQQEDGLVPGSIWLGDGEPRFSKTVSHPPMWPVAVNDYCDQTGSDELLRLCYEPLLRQIGWFEANRKAEDEGYYYTDIVNHSWESGVDEGVRFDDVPTGRYACVDATAHVYMLYDVAADWAVRLGAIAQPGRAGGCSARLHRRTPLRPGDRFLPRHLGRREPGGPAPGCGGDLSPRGGRRHGGTGSPRHRREPAEPGALPGAPPHLQRGAERPSL